MATALEASRGRFCREHKGQNAFFFFLFKKIEVLWSHLRKLCCMSANEDDLPPLGLFELLPVIGMLLGLNAHSYKLRFRTPSPIYVSRRSTFPADSDPFVEQAS